MSASGQLDIKRAIDAVTQDPNWARKCFMAGLPILIPIIGWVALLGWERRHFEAVREGRDAELPEPSLSEDLSRGVDPAIAVLNALPFVVLTFVMTFGLPLATGLVSTVVAQVSQPLAGLIAVSGTLMQLFGMFLSFALITMINLISPELLRRAFLGEHFPLYSPRVSLSLIKEHLNDFVVVLVLSLLANLLAGFGVYLCCVGLLLTRPIAVAFQGHMLGQWQAKLDARAGA